MDILEYEKNKKIIQGIKVFYKLLDDDEKIYYKNQIEKSESIVNKFDIKNLVATLPTPVEIAHFRGFVIKTLKKEFGSDMIMSETYASRNSNAQEIRRAIFKTFDDSEVMNLFIVRGRNYSFLDSPQKKKVFKLMSDSFENEVVSKFINENKQLINKYKL